MAKAYILHANHEYTFSHNVGKPGDGFYCNPNVLHTPAAEPGMSMLYELHEYWHAIE